MDPITLQDFSKIEIRVGKVIEVVNKEGSDKLLRLIVDFGSFGQRLIFTGVRTYGFTADDFQNRQFLFVVNLEPKKMMDEMSHGMILAVDSSASSEQAGNKPVFVSAEGLPLGSKVR